MFSASANSASASRGLGMADCARMYICQFWPLGDFFLRILRALAAEAKFGTFNHDGTTGTTAIN